MLNRTSRNENKSDSISAYADESLTSLAVYFCNWHMFRENMNNITC